MMAAHAATDEERLAAQGDLRELIRLSRERGELEVIKGANTHLEMGALYELSLRDRYPPHSTVQQSTACFESQNKNLFLVCFSKKIPP